MKNIITIILLGMITGIKAQVIIGDALGTTTDKTSVLLDFAAGQNKGLILPYVRELPTSNALTEGAIILDATRPTSARVKFYNGSSWVDLSGQDANLVNPIDHLAVQPSILAAPESLIAKAIIGAKSSVADGVLVLESDTKAMILPIVSDVQKIPKPSPGMMVYVNKTGKKRLAVFNGAKWSFWKP
ncbi:hypothetical protein [Kaistella antarctica]|uniref:Uncharacterized protein n=1 Tax=Kaistella antarctica TaxID=266748 RepID=A0A3S4VF58_9FLAO|nr:hypothetical protein [Kaistella antarctica]KEY18700.1 hypothetical protein HY04_09465 [Kaistella antarctica]SEW16463.1 hypothetical protein SAMN05421765_2840 [Kaistella antarctica]VEH99697.1 Uncharacterised protein [Kaistella antarctica]